MIIQCPKCETKFRVPDAKVASAGVKVRCSKCAHLFVVRKEPEAPGPSPAPSIPAAPTMVSGPPGSMMPHSDKPELSGADHGDAPLGPPQAPEDDLRLSSVDFPPEKGPSDRLSGAKDPFDWSGASLTGDVDSEPVSGDPFLGPGAPRFGSSADLAAGPPPLPPRPSSGAPFSEDLAPSGELEDEGSLRFPPPPALTNDLDPEADDDWSQVEPPPSEAIGQDPFDAPEEPSMPSNPPLAEPTPPPPVAEPTSPSREIPIMRGQAAPPSLTRSVDVPVISKGTGPRPHPPVSALRWPPWLGVALGLAAALYAVPELLGDAPSPPTGGSADLETIGIRVSPYADALPPRLWVVSGTVETKSRPFPHGVQVEIRLPGEGAEPVFAQAILGQEVPESILAAGPEAVAKFMRLTPPPSLGPASRQRFVTIVDSEPQSGDIDVRYEALAPREPSIAVDGSDSPG
ncbi:MAG: zinc-ribbon domain-containing protein [Myxococcota bacterium]